MADGIQNPDVTVYLENDQRGVFTKPSRDCLCIRMSVLLELTLVAKYIERVRESVSDSERKGMQHQVGIRLNMAASGYLADEHRKRNLGQSVYTWYSSPHTATWGHASIFDSSKGTPVISAVVKCKAGSSTECIKHVRQEPDQGKILKRAPAREQQKVITY